jgi:hypothetical protein
MQRAGGGGRHGRAVVQRRIRLKLSITVHQDVYAEAAVLAGEREVSLSRVCEAALVAYLKARHRPVPPQLDAVA